MAKPKWPKLESFLIPLFKNAHVYLCTSKAEWIQAEASIGLPAADLKGINGRCRQFIHEDTGESLYLIGVFDGRSATLVYECAHATFYCCHDVGVTIETDQPNETYCYLLDRMFSHFLPHIKQESSCPT